MMFKNGIKNFFVNLKHFFTPIGTLSLGLVLGLSIFIPAFLSAISTAVTEVNALLQEIHIDFSAMLNSVINSFTSADWSDPVITIQRMLSKEWFSSTIQEAINAAIAESLQLLQENLPVILGNAVNTIVSGAIALVVSVALGILVGHCLTSSLVRRTIARRAFWKMFLAYFVDIVLNVALIAFCVWLATLWTYSLIFTLIVVVLTVTYKELLEAYLLQGFKKVKFKEIVNFRNALQHLMSTLVIWVIVIGMVLIVYYFVNVVVAIVIGIALVEIALAVNSLNAEAYVKSRLPASAQ